MVQPHIGHMSLSVQAFKSLGKLTGKLTMPIYAAHGTSDRCTSLKVRMQACTQVAQPHTST